MTGREPKSAAWWWGAGVLVVTVIFVMMALVLANKKDPAPLAGRVASQVVRLNGVMYYDGDDQQSQDQQAQFGPYWTELKKINCREQVDLCVSLGIEETPTILVPGFAVGISGYQDLNDLELLLTQIEERR